MFLWNIAVTSLAEVWIEISGINSSAAKVLSLPSRKCGLKFHIILIPVKPLFVTSLAEVWIEMVFEYDILNNQRGHFPRGSVD
mgnify:CR=1 FL=1